MIPKALFSSNSSEWETPSEIFDPLNEEFHFDLDVCATKENAKVYHYYADAFHWPWSGVCWMNPPYERGPDGIIRWMEKAYWAVRERGEANVVVCLVPARTDTKWWHEYAMRATEIRLLRGRIKFVGAPSSAPFPSAIIIFTRSSYTALRTPKVTAWNWKKEKKDE